MANNPGAFSPAVEDRVPTSVDLLEPPSLMLQAVERLPFSPYITLNSIIGVGRWMVGNGPSDGVVPVDSARHPGVASERFVAEKHTEIHHDSETVAEVIRILRQHASY